MTFKRPIFGRLVKRLIAEPVDLTHRHDAGRQQPLSGRPPPVSCRSGSSFEPRRADRPGPPMPEAATLADRVVDHALDGLPSTLAVRYPRSHPDPLRRACSFSMTAGIIRRSARKQISWLSGLSATGKPVFGRQGAGLRPSMSGGPSGKAQVIQLLRRGREQEIALIARRHLRRPCAVLARAAPSLPLDVVPRRHAIGIEITCAVASRSLNFTRSLQRIQGTGVAHRPGSCRQTRRSPHP